MIKADFTYNPNNSDFFDYLLDQYRLISDAIDSSNITIIKRITVLELQPYLIITPDQSEIVVLEKFVKLKVDFN